MLIGTLYTAPDKLFVLVSSPRTSASSSWPFSSVMYRRHAASGPLQSAGLLMNKVMGVSPIAPARPLPPVPSDMPSVSTIKEPENSYPLGLSAPSRVIQNAAP